jgi:hypothetical protein
MYQGNFFLVNSRAILDEEMKRKRNELYSTFHYQPISNWTLPRKKIGKFLVYLGNYLQKDVIVQFRTHC